MIKLIRENILFVFGILCTIIIASATSHAIYKDDNSCNKVIFLKGELSRDINQVQYVANGQVARIHYCDGTTEDVLTSRIVKVVIK
jgi:hypothetical protein